MNHPHYSQQRERAARVYRWLLRLYPAAHQRAFGEQMRQTFSDHYRDGVEEGGEPETRFWLGVVADEGKSLLREHIAALREGKSVMKTLKPALLMILPLALVYSLTVVLEQPFDLAGRLKDALQLACIAVLLLLLASLLRAVSAADTGRSWVRIGLVAGGLMALFFTVLNLLYAVVPLPPLSSDFRFNEVWVWNQSLPLLGGVVGVLGGYAGGKIRTGIAACLIAGGIGALGYAASQGLLVAVLWNQLSHHLLHSHLQDNYLGAIQFYQLGHGQPATFWNFLLFGGGPDGDGGVMTYLGNGVYSVVMEGVFAVSGAVLGATVRSRADEAGRRVAGSVAPSIRAWLLMRPVGVTFLALILGSFAWAGIATQNLITQFNDVPFTLGALGRSFLSPAFTLWLLGVLVVLACVLVSVRPTIAPSEARAT